MKNIDAEREKELDKKAKILTLLSVIGFIFIIICFIYCPYVIGAIILIAVFYCMGKTLFVDIIYPTIQDHLYKKEQQEENDEEECVYWY